MKLYLYGHDYKYAAEQMLLTLFPALYFLLKYRRAYHYL